MAVCRRNQQMNADILFYIWKLRAPLLHTRAPRTLTTAARANNYIARTTVTMRSCTIVKALVLAIGAIAVVARSPRVQRQEINARAGRGYGFSNSPTKNDGADAKDTTGGHFRYFRRPPH